MSIGGESGRKSVVRGTYHALGALMLFARTNNTRSFENGVCRLIYNTISKVTHSANHPHTGTTISTSALFPPARIRGVPTLSGWLGEVTELNLSYEAIDSDTRCLSPWSVGVLGGTR